MLADTSTEAAVNNFSSPLITQDEKIKEVRNGFSFNSKKVAVGPMFFNLRIMCDCVGRALRRHIDFSMKHQCEELNADLESNDAFWFLDHISEAKLEAKRAKRKSQKLEAKL